MTQFPFNIYLAGFASAFLAGTIGMLLWRRLGYLYGWVDAPGERKIHSVPIALTGGMGVITGILFPIVGGIIALFLWPGLNELLGITTGLKDLFIYGFQRRGGQLGVVLLGAIGMLLLGWVDDRIELKPGAKFCGQLLIAATVAAAGVRITLFVPNLLFSYLVTILWILTITNAFNFMDNMNGLCAGLGVVALWSCAWAAAVNGQFLVATFAFLLCGALFSFIPFNFPSASIFLGDSGSHLTGFLAAVMSILPSFYSAEVTHRLTVVTPLLLLFIPLLDLVSVVIIRWKNGKAFYIGDNNHLSHRLVRHGYSKSFAVLILLLCSAFLSAASFLLR
ncbi:MAG: MraY family glycosyltransferase [Verrucomicrobiota bacterium]|nr:MraY family glycosyltransferase [Verrucomicrobiota bacterium]